MPKLVIKMDAEKVVAAFLKSPELVSRELRRELKQQLTDVQDEAQNRHRFTTRSGHLESSIQIQVDQSGLRGRVYLETGIANYGPFVHEGTGIYGKRKKPIVPVRAKYLKFTGRSGRDVFAKKVRGVRPDRFLTDAFRRQKEKISHAMEQATNRALRKAGLI